MLLSKIVEVIIYAGAVQGFFLALVLSTAKNGKRKSNRILSALLIILSLSIIHLLFVGGTIGFSYKIKEPFILLIGPLLLLYIQELISPRRLILTDAFHLIPFFLFFLILLPATIFGAASAYGEFLLRNEIAMSLIVWTLVVVQYGYYWWKIVRLINTHRAAVEMEFSNTEGKTLSWMKIFLHVFGVFFFLLLVTLGLAVHRVEYSVVDTVICIALSCTIFVLGYEGLLQEEIFSNVSEMQSNVVMQAETERSAEPRQVSPQDNELVQKLLTYLDEKKPYLNEALTLTELSKQLEMTRNQLSFLINNNLDNTFYTFINKYRVNEVKRLISDPKNKKFTILSLAYEAGFPSKSSFHSIFKNVTSLTPTEYRNRLQ